MTVGNATPGIDEAEYAELMRAFPPRVIRDEAQLRAAEHQFEKLLALEERTPAQDAYLDLLSTLVECWEADRVEIPSVSGAEVVKFLCEMRGIPQRALVPVFGTASIVSEVLAGKRELQRKHIAGFASFFHVSPAAFFPSTDAPRGKREQPRHEASMRWSGRRPSAPVRPVRGRGRPASELVIEDRR